MGRSRSSLALAAVALAALAPTAPAQDTPGAVVLRPGHPAVDGTRIAPHQANWTVLRESADGERDTLGVWGATFDTVLREGRTLLRHQTEFLDLVGSPVHREVNLMDRATLTPIRDEQTGLGGTRAIVDFDGAAVRARVRSPASNEFETFEETLAEAPFTLDVVLYGWPLDEGDAFRLPFAGQLLGGEGLEWHAWRVTDREKVEAGSLGKPRAWVVEDAARGWTAWVVDEPPYVVRLEIEDPEIDRIWLLEDVHRLPGAPTVLEPEPAPSGDR